MTDWKNVLSPISPPQQPGPFFFLEALLLIIAHPCFLFQYTFVLLLKDRNESQVCKGQVRINL